MMIANEKQEQLALRECGLGCKERDGFLASPSPLNGSAGRFVV